MKREKENPSYIQIGLTTGNCSLIEISDGSFMMRKEECKRNGTEGGRERTTQ